MPARKAANPATPSPRLAALFPGGVAAAELREPADINLLYPEEKAHVERSAERRVRDFAGGRLCARLALAEFGIHHFPLHSGEDRCALWPKAVVGSITHTKGYCAAVVAPRSHLRAIGIDAEVIDRVTPQMRGMICTDAEREWIDTLDAADQALVTALAFSSKEAFYKCQYTLSRQWLDFQDVCILPEKSDLKSGRFVLKLIKHVDALVSVGSVYEGCFVVDGPLIVTAMAFAA